MLSRLYDEKGLGSLGTDAGVVNQMKWKIDF
jgi:hypothetical protein